MSLIVRNVKKTYENVTEGLHRAVLADVVDVGEVETKFGPKHRVRLVWLTDELGKDGKHLAIIRTFNKSLHEKSLLRKAIKQITGKDPGDEFDLQDLIGTNAKLNVEWTESEGLTYAHVTAILKLQKGDERLEIPATWVRRKDRDLPGSKPPKTPSAVPAEEPMEEPMEEPIDDADLPDGI
jgi:hypothetical protein